MIYPILKLHNNISHSRLIFQFLYAIHDFIDDFMRGKHKTNNMYRNKKAEHAPNKQINFFEQSKKNN